MNAIYRDRADAGRRLAALLSAYAGRHDTLVLGLPRGGVPVACEVARALTADLDVFLVRKLGVPGREELALGAIATGGVRVLNEGIVRALHIAPEAIDAVTAAQERVLRQRERLYRDDAPLPQIRNQTVMLVDDGMATGATMLAAVAALRQQAPAHLIAAVPVAAESTCREVAAEVDEMICAATPDPFYAVGLWYDDFGETTDDEIRRLLGAGV